ncbi:MAG TPA: transporter [Candidatus Didemnitutus sp.]|nr:transporter [Candidatus Didemnitutus sp.]
MRSLLAAFVSLLPLALAASEGTSAPVDKSGYSLFNPTPAEHLRDLSPDRPDLTESPYTVDAGWWQLEMDFVAYSRDHDRADGANVVSTATSFANINLKVGLTSKIDLQTVLSPYTRAIVQDNNSGTRVEATGFGDIETRLKINFWGDDGGESAFGIMPFVKWPTSQHGLGNHSVEGGLILPYAHELPAGFDIGMMTEWDVVRNDDDTGYTSEWVNSVTLGHDLVGKLGCYVELASILKHGPGEAYFDCGLTYGIDKNVQLDAGTSIGLTHSSNDLVLFTGFTVRF